jgi:hypothetical protein
MKIMHVDLGARSIEQSVEILHPNPYGLTQKVEVFPSKKLISYKELFIDTKLPIRPKLNQKLTLEGYIFLKGTSNRAKDTINSKFLGDGEMEGIA